ncbi:MAG: preprotein translocase subunit SecA [Opitutales bacterium]|nr:preprotein translocase subunit SecA [Opitutales bacterium]
MRLSIFNRFSGSHYRRFYKKCRPIVSRINALEESYQSLSDSELQAKTEEFRKRFQEGETLDSLLPEAFATVKNAARRLCGRKFMVRGHELEWNMVHYDVQLIGGMALHQGMVAEMATGEGKTLVATLPLYLNALSGKNCQLVTVNEYLAQRDSEWMGNLYSFLGLTVGCILGAHQQSPTEKRGMYHRDITYGTASEFGFDYLRDNGMATRAEELVQRDHFFVIVDEVDSVLIDEARTPLIISGPSQDSDVGEIYTTLRPAIEHLVTVQNRLCNRLISEAKAELSKPAEDRQARAKAYRDAMAKNEKIRARNVKIAKDNEAREAKGQEALPLEPLIDVPDFKDPYPRLFQVTQGMPKNKVLLRLLEDGVIRKEFDSFDLELNADHYKEYRYSLKEELYYVIDEKQHSVDLTENGRQLLRPNDEDAFVLPDLPTIYMEIDKEEIEPRQKDQKKLAAQQRFEQISEEIHAISQLLRAYGSYERDVEYVVQEGKVLIVDEHTGRVMPGRRWSDGLHQAVEAKERVQIERETKTYATITLQNYFRLYEKLAGMTGTAETEANEFMDIYKLQVMVIPTNRPCVRKDENDLIYKTRREKYNAAVEEIKQAHDRGQPCLVGTVSVEASELLSRMLRRANIPHNVLNAKYHESEAEIVERAGQKGAVTIATNMAGRGTDIKLAEGVSELGGLYVIGTERHTSRRIDRQLRGRSARQGDPGRSLFFLSLEDDLMRLYSNQGIAGKLLQNSFVEGEPLQHRWLNTAIERAQKTVEQHHYSSRKRLLQYDDVLNQQREVVYNLREEAILSETPRDVIFSLIEEEIEYRLGEFGLLETRKAEAEKVQEFAVWMRSHFPVILQTEELVDAAGEQIREAAIKAVNAAYATKEAAEEPEALVRLERYVIIQHIDHNWQSHLTEMEDLRQAVMLRSYGQKDPLMEYKNEAFSFFEQMINDIRLGICSGIFRNATNVKAFENLMALLQRARQSGPADPDGDQGPNRLGTRPPMPVKNQPAPVKQQPVVNEGEHVGRNDTVTIVRGPERKEVKLKKARQMIAEEGWKLEK